MYCYTRDLPGDGRFFLSINGGKGRSKPDIPGEFHIYLANKLQFAKFPNFAICQNNFAIIFKVYIKPTI